MSFHLSPRRLTAAAALGVVAVLACAGPASAAPSDAATWLSGPEALTDGDHIEIGGFSYDGTAADAVFALVAAGGHDATVQAITTYLAGDVDNYADPSGAAGGPYSGSLAKLAITAETTGQDPHAFGGVDLLGVLTSKTCAAAIPVTDPNVGTPCHAPGEFYNAFSTISQALGVIALQRSPVAADHLATTSAPFTRLTALECADGLYTGTLFDPGATCATGDADTTAYVAQALAAVLGPDDPAVTKALTALQAAQLSGGGFDGASGINTNTTGVALSAFSLQPTTFAAAIQSGRAFIGGLQLSSGAYRATATDKPAEQLDLSKGATPQALLGVLGGNLAGIVVAPPTTTPPTTTAPTSGAPAPAVAGAPELAETGASNGLLALELALATTAIAGGGVLVRAGSRRLPIARHRG